MKSLNSNISQISIQPSDKRERLIWVDSMRGFSMIIVVLGHVLMSMGIGGYESFLSTVLLTFRMPLFFFVSGYFSFRAIEWWTKRKVGDILKRKFQAQILCTMLFVSIYQYVMGGGNWLVSGFGGYWFTIVLFQMYILYLTLSLLSRLIKCNFTIPAMILASIAGLAILVLWRNESWTWNFFCWENLTKYFQFFTLGIICSKYRHRFFSLLSRKWFSTLTVCGWIVCMLIYYSDSIHAAFPLAYSLVHDIAVRYFALLTVIMLFHSNATYFSGQTRTAGILKFIGQRTLDIYMIHYFFLPNLRFMHDFLSSGNMIVIQLITALLITSVIIALCLLISYILRQSDTLKAWLFGVKIKPTAQTF